MKYYTISIPVAIITVIGAVCILMFSGQARNAIFSPFQKLSNIQKSAPPALSDIRAEKDAVVITYDHHQLLIKLKVKDKNSFDFHLSDENGQGLACQKNPDNGAITIQDKRFSGTVITPESFQNSIGFSVVIGNNKWFFTNQTKDGTYYYVNQYGKLDKIIPAPSAFFKGYENYASGRGYIWSRTIPLLKKYILLGSGADTFALAFPHQDYINAYNYGYGTMFISKPHCLYLQMGVQTGVLSLLAYLVFYMIYFISSICIYIKGHFKSDYAKIGLGIFVGTFGYMICSLTNDSSITVAPVFWVLIGLGIVMNYKAKAFMEEEAKEASGM